MKLRKLADLVWQLLWQMEHLQDAAEAMIKKKPQKCRWRRYCKSEMGYHR